MTQKLSHRERTALRECAEYTDRGRAYPWNPKTMAKMAAMGLAEVASSQYGGRNVDVYRVTDRGRATLSEDQ